MRRPTGATWPRALAPSVAIAALFTIAVLAVPSLRFAYDNLSLHVALETTEGLVAVLLATLCAGRYRRTAERVDLLLTAAFVGLAVTNLAVSALPMIAAGDRPEGFVTWLALVLRLEAAAALCSAAFASRDARTARGWPLLAALGIALALVLATAAGAWLDEPIDPTLSPDDANRPTFTGHAAVIAALAASFALHVGAAIGFTRRARQRHDELVDWLAAGSAVAAVARLHYLLFPSLYSNWVYTGDLLRLASYGLFLAGAVGALVAHWQATAALAAAQERSRLARELHDGLVQELSFIRSQTAGRVVLEGQVVEHIADAAERGLAESRLGLDALAQGDAPLADALRSAAEVVSRRAGAAVSVAAVDGSTPVSLPVRHAMLRVAREAATNAVRHGRARTVDITVEREGTDLVMVVRDDGDGFDPATMPQGFGLRSMRERIEGLGGRLEIEAARGRGTRIRVALPEVAVPDHRATPPRTGSGGCGG